MSTRSAARLGPAALQRGLRAWIAGHDAHVRAAVLLLIEHEHWLRDRDFLGAAVNVVEHEVDDEHCEGHESLAGEHMGEAIYCPNDECVKVRRRHDPAEIWISWGNAGEVLGGSKCSSTEYAVLDLAIALATNRYRLAQMGAANSSAIARAVAAAAGVRLEPTVEMAR